MRAGFLGSDAAQIRARAKRSARGRENQARPSARVGARARQALVDRVVLAVERQQAAPTLLHRGHQQAAGADHGLLVGEQQLLARLRRGQRGREPRGANDGGDHDVDLGRAHYGLERLGAGRRLRGEPQPAQRRSQCVEPRRVGDHRHLRTMLRAQLRELLDARGGGQRSDLEGLGVARHHVERRGADRARGAQQGDATALHANNLSISAAAGSTGTSASMRS